MGGDFNCVLGTADWTCHCNYSTLAELVNGFNMHDMWRQPEREVFTPFILQLEQPDRSILRHKKRIWEEDSGRNSSWGLHWSRGDAAISSWYPHLTQRKGYLEAEQFLNKRRKQKSESAQQLGILDTSEAALSEQDHVVEQTSQKENRTVLHIERCRTTAKHPEYGKLLLWMHFHYPAKWPPMCWETDRLISLQSKESANTQCPLQRIMIENDEADKMEQENPTFSHVLRMHQRRYARDIQQIQYENGHMHAWPRNIMQVFATYFRRKYDSTPIDEDSIDDIVRTAVLNPRPIEDKFLERLMKVDEFLQELRVGRNNKEPGSEGITVEFY